MVCTTGQPQTAELTTASFYRTTLSLGPATVLVRGQLAASPSFPPDGKTIAYLGPSTPGGGFQLWTVSAWRTPASTPPRLSSTPKLDAACPSASISDGRR